MISEQDKTFIARMKVPQAIVAEEIEDKIIKPKLYYEVMQKKKIQEYINGKDVVEEILTTYDSWLADEPKYPKVTWKNIFKQDETQSIANAIALLNAGIIDVNRAAAMVGEIPAAQQQKEDAGKISLEMPLSAGVEFQPDVQPQNQQQTPMNFDTQANMQLMRGQLNVAGKKDQSNRNIADVKDPTQLGGSRYAQHETKGDKGDISQKHVGLEKADNDIKVGSKISITDGVRLI
jgi:hypothetical protein